MPPVPSFRSSGDILADRRYEYARAAFDEGDLAAASDLARQALELAPRFAAAHALLGRAEAASARPEAAVAALREALALEPDDALGVRLDLARLGAIAPEAAITDGYVRALFDDYAPQFERHLVRNLSYRGPDLLADALRRAAVRRMRAYRFRAALDLGCGTGLMARALEGVAATVEGVDLSPRMLAKAAKTHFTMRCTRANSSRSFADERRAKRISSWRRTSSSTWRIFRPRFAEAHRVLERDGFFAFTVQGHDGEGVVLGEDARYAHGEDYLRGLAARTGFATIIVERVSTREDRGKPVPGFLAVLER